MCNKFYKNINRPYADIDFSQVRSWDLVMSMMESQAIAATAQMNAKSQQSQSQVSMPTPVSNDMLPVHLTNVYKDNPICYGNGSSNGEESDNSSYYSDEEMSPQHNTSTRVNTDSDIEIDVEDCSDDSFDQFYENSESDNIPMTVLHLEEQIRERTNQPKQVRQTRSSRSMR
ncbi:unnamed protein product [Diamesa serratosioi]